MRHALTAIEAAILLGSPIPLIAPGLEIRLGALRQKHPPGALEIGAGLVECGGRAVLLLARMGPRIEATTPLPRILIMGIAAADRDRADVHVGRSRRASIPRG